MIIIKKKILLYLILICLSIGINACTSIYHPPPIPSNLEIVPPSSSIPPEIAAFSGIWKGRWGGIKKTDSIIIIEEIDTKTSEIIFSFGGNNPGYINLTGEVHPGPVIKWRTDKWPFEKDDPVCPCALTFKMSKSLKSMIVFWEFDVYNFKLRGDFTRQKESLTRY